MVMRFLGFLAPLTLIGQALAFSIAVPSTRVSRGVLRAAVDDYASLTVEALKEKCRERGLKVSGKKVRQMCAH